MATGGQYRVYLSLWTPPTTQTAGYWGDYVELEDTFRGMIYKSCEGLETQGEPKFYREDFAESSSPKVYLSNVVNTNDIEFEFVFRDLPAQGTTPAVNRFTVYNNFVTYITGKKFKFYDSERLIKRDMYLSGAITVTESSFKGVKYLVAKFPCTSLNTPNLQ